MHTVITIIVSLLAVYFFFVCLQERKMRLRNRYVVLHKKNDGSQESYEFWSKDKMQSHQVVSWAEHYLGDEWEPSEDLEVLYMDDTWASEIPENWVEEIARQRLTEEEANEFENNA